jgi:hypothetical protein
MLESSLRQIVTAGLVVLATMAGGWAAIPSASAATTATTASSATSASRAIPAEPAAALSGGLRGYLPAAHPVAYPDGVAPAATSPFDEVQDVSCFHAGDCVAVGVDATQSGSGATPLAYLWNGRAWKSTTVRLPSGIKYAVLISVSCKPGACMAVGTYQRGTKYYPLAESWNGDRWTDSLPPAAAGASTTAMQWVSCYSSKDCVATGVYNPASDSDQDIALAEVWNGHSWRSSKPSVPTSVLWYTDLDTGSCPTATFCLLGGLYSERGGYLTTFLERFDGKHWTQLYDAAPTPNEGSAGYINSLSCTSATACVAVGELTPLSGTSVTWHGFTEVLTGSTWRLTGEPLPAGTNSLLNDVSCASATYCVAVGGYGPYNSNTGGKAAYATWNGSTWAAHFLYPTSGDGSQLFGLQCLATNYCVAGGTEGPYNKDSAHTLSAFWNGSTWKQLNT